MLCALSLTDVCRIFEPVPKQKQVLGSNPTVVFRLFTVSALIPVKDVEFVAWFNKRRYN